MLLNVFRTLASAKKKVEYITEQIAVGIIFGGIADTKLIVNKSANTWTIKFLVREKNTRKRNDGFRCFYYFWKSFGE